MLSLVLEYKSSTSHGYVQVRTNYMISQLWSQERFESGSRRRRREDRGREVGGAQ